MPNSYSLNASYDIDLIQPDLLYQQFAAADPLLNLLPPKYTGASKVVWEQKDNVGGLMFLRGLGGAPTSVPLPGYSRFETPPGYYGEFTTLDETELTVGKEPGSAFDPVDIGTRVTDMMTTLTTRNVNLMKYAIATLLTTGKYLYVSPDGRMTHAAQVDNFNLLSPGVGWAASPATADPLGYLRSQMFALNAGTSARFGPKSILLANEQTVSDILNTAKVQTAYRNDYGATINRDNLDKLFLGFGLPPITVYDDGYYATQAAAKAQDLTQYFRFIPNKTLIWVADRPDGQVLGNFQMTRNLYKELPGNFGFAGQDSRRPNADVSGYGFEDGLYALLRYLEGPPLSIRYDLGFNGGPAIRYPKMVAAVTYA